VNLHSMDMQSLNDLGSPSPSFCLGDCGYEKGPGLPFR
jgi:hypothetical protein